MLLDIMIKNLQCYKVTKDECLYHYKRGVMWQSHYAKILNQSEIENKHKVENV